MPEWRRFRFPQSLYKYVALIGSIWFVWWSLEVLRIDVDRLPGLFARVADVLANRYWPPDLAHVRQPDFINSVIETFQMSYVATVVGAAACTFSRRCWHNRRPCIDC